MRVAGLGYDAEYVCFDDREVVHAVVPYVDVQVRALAPVWLPHVAPAPLCGLAGEAGTQVTRSSGALCRACAAHLRDLDEWVREAEAALTDPDGAVQSSPEPAAIDRVHAMPF